jgi:signal peptidase I
VAAHGEGNLVSEEPHDSTRTRMTVAEAARALGISESAVRKRVKRGRLEHERTPNGRLIVYLNSAATSATGRDRVLEESHDARTERYVRGLEDRVEHLRNELDQEREANRENRAIITALEERIAELEVSQTARVEPERRERHPLKIDSKDAVLVQFFITAGASIAAAAVLVISVLNGQVLLAGLAGGLTLLSIASFLSHRWLFRSGTDRVQERPSEPRSEAPASRQEERHQDRQAVKKKLPLHLDFLIQFLVILALVFGFVRPFVMEAFWIPSGSMIPTLEIGDRVFVNKFIYRFTEPERGDIIVFESVDNGEVDLIKRVVGVPGDEIAVRGGKLFVNGEPQKEPYTNKKLPDRSSFAKTTVPKDHVFVMGDNRANSADSRVFGALPEKNIEGEAFLRFWPPDRIGLL